MGAKVRVWNGIGLGGDFDDGRANVSLRDFSLLRTRSPPVNGCLQRCGVRRAFLHGVEGALVDGGRREVFFAGSRCLTEP